MTKNVAHSVLEAFLTYHYGNRPDGQTNLRKCRNMRPRRNIQRAHISTVQASKPSIAGCTVAGVDLGKARIVSKRVPFGEFFVRSRNWPPAWLASDAESHSRRFPLQATTRYGLINS